MWFSSLYCQILSLTAYNTSLSTPYCIYGHINEFYNYLKMEYKSTFLIPVIVLLVVVI